jgi:hypothetical protein
MTKTLELAAGTFHGSGFNIAFLLGNAPASAPSSR